MEQPPDEVPEEQLEDGGSWPYFEAGTLGTEAAMREPLGCLAFLVGGAVLGVAAAIWRRIRGRPREG